MLEIGSRPGGGGVFVSEGFGKGGWGRGGGGWRWERGDGKIGGKAEYITKSPLQKPQFAGIYKFSLPKSWT